MYKPFASMAVWFALVAAPALAADPVDVQAGLKKINAEYLQKTRAALGSPNWREAATQRKAALEALVKQAEEADPTKLPAEQQTALASACMQLGRLPDAVKYAEMAIQSDPMQKEANTVLIASLARQGNMESAETALAAMAQRFPDASELSSMHDTLYLAYLRARQPVVAAGHVAASLELQSKRLATMPQPQASAAMRRFASDAERMATAYSNARQLEEGIQRVDVCIATVADMAKNGSSPALSRLASDLLASKAKLVGPSGKWQEAQALVKEELDRAKKDLGESPDDLDHVLRVAKLLAAAVDLNGTNPAVADAFRKEHLAFLGEQVNKKPANREILMAFVSANAAAAGALQKGDRVVDALALLKSAQDTVGAVETTDEAAKKSLQAAKQQLLMAARRFESELLRAKLIGQPAVAVETSDWVNGSPVAPADTKGKVVLLDFWAVWCGPCIATFPHLRQWHDKYADKGLVIIGATKYYGYGWNAEEKHSEKIEALTHQDEQAAMTQFAKHHELRHALAVMLDDGLSKKYGVTGIPQAVVIDRAGKVRLIKVGSGEANAKALEEMIEKCLAETPESAAEAGGGSGS